LERRIVIAEYRTGRPKNERKERKKRKKLKSSHGVPEG